jgi:hypothetical protein
MTGATGVLLLGVVVYGPVPTLFTAATRNTYGVPFVSPVTIVIVAVPVCGDPAREKVVQIELPPYGATEN